MREDDAIIAEAGELGSAEVVPDPAAAPPGSPAGLLLALGAYTWWGLVTPTVFWHLKGTSAIELLVHRVIWGLPVVLVLLGIRRQLGTLRSVFRSRAHLRVLAITTLLVGVNWYVFVLAVTTERTIEASLGYYVNPFVSMALGVIVLHERLRPAQWAAVACAIVGVASLFVTRGAAPWISIMLATTFGLYGLMRKQAQVSALVGLAVEMTLMFPLALGLFLLLADPTKSPLVTGPTSMRLLIMATGVVTIVPLTLFVAGARRLRLVTIGFLQYLAPTAQFVLAVMAFGEPLTTDWLVAFGFIWAAVAIYATDAVRGARHG